MSANFVQFAAHFPAIGTDVLTRLAELFRVFNSRATQLVLGAGAIHSAAKLKSISAKHLALCCQSLGLVKSLIPLLKAALATRLPQKHHLLLAQMDAVSQVRLPGSPGQDSQQVCVDDRRADRGKIELAQAHRLGHARRRRRGGRGARRRGKGGGGSTDGGGLRSGRGARGWGGGGALPVHG
ncbi:unnamed protein product [Hapterophycus canaliculatus]